MNKKTLIEKYVELYSKNEVLSKSSKIRLVENFLNRKYPAAKMERIIDDLERNNDIKTLSKSWIKQKKLSSILDGIVDHKIHYIYKENRHIDLLTTNDAILITLIKKILLDFGYEILFFPPIKTNIVDFIVYRNNIKITVFVIKRSLDKPVDKSSLANFLDIQKNLKCEKSIIFTNSTFTEDAHEFSNHHEMTLVNHKKINELIYDKLKTAKTLEKEHLIKEKKIIKKPSFFLESDIKSKKTKVNVKEIKYIPDKENNVLTFTGTLRNIGKHPANKLKINLRLYGRDRAPVYVYNEIIDDGYLENGDSKPFRIEFKDLDDFQWKNLCRYSIKLNYR